MQIENARAVVVGGASGMARATAELLAQGGAKVAVLDLPASEGASVAKQIGGSFFAVDITDEASVAAAIAGAADALGGIDVGVNVAGGGIAKRTLTKEGPHPLADFRRVVDLNLVATFDLLRLEADVMSRNEPNADGERGVIVNTASIAAFEGQIGQVAYAAAKAGIVGMTYVAARDLGSLGIRVNAIAPSLFQTGITKLVPEAMAAALTKDAAFPKRMGKPGEYALLAKAIIENPMLNGGTIRLDAGQRFAPK
ncbi:MAG: SDR family NAD(P)-dependent oxidoreductase [Myxococcota bacterium]|nr:SDR family NAD(P)-dependent oxidoreductase [Myxococcales bacterium]